MKDQPTKQPTNRQTDSYTSNKTSRTTDDRAMILEHLVLPEFENICVLLDKHWTSTESLAVPNPEQTIDSIVHGRVTSRPFRKKL